MTTEYVLTSRMTGRVLYRTTNATNACKLWDTDPEGIALTTRDVSADDNYGNPDHFPHCEWCGKVVTDNDDASHAPYCSAECERDGRRDEGH